MRAVYYSENGPASQVLKLGDLPAPAPAAGEVLVRTRASGINPIDVKWRRGLKPVEAGKKTIPHFDGAGTIEKVGAGVPASRVGERVWVFEAVWQRDGGTAAEYVALPAERAVRLPDGVDFAGGACLGIPALTAHRCVFADGPVDGQTVLVTGGAGAVGEYAVQFAKLGGAWVIATVSGDAKARAASAAGADAVLNYRNEDVAKRVMAITAGQGVDRIVEVALGANFPVSKDIMRNNGVIAAYASDVQPEPTLPFRAFLYKNVTLRHVLVFGVPADAKRQAIADITRWLETGRLKNHVGQRFPLDQAAKAHEAVEQGAIGNVVLEIG